LEWSCVILKILKTSFVKACACV